MPNEHHPAVSLSYIALGSNLNNPRRQLELALDAIARLPHSRLRARSGWYQSKAIGPGEQPDYLNGVVLIETSLEPHTLLRRLQEIEAAQGRVRGERWAARTLDLDILLYGERVIDTEVLQIPHPRMTERNFVLYPLADISPDLLLPNGTPLAALLRLCNRDGLKRVRS